MRRLRKMQLDIGNEPTGNEPYYHLIKKNNQKPVFFIVRHNFSILTDPSNIEYSEIALIEHFSLNTGFIKSGRQ